jgi:hypothetical protein
MEFKILDSCYYADFEDACSKNYDEGWIIVGSMNVYLDNYNNSHFIVLLKRNINVKGGTK